VVAVMVGVAGNLITQSPTLRPSPRQSESPSSPSTTARSLGQSQRTRSSNSPPRRRIPGVRGGRLP
jgi:hypothetical protein